MPEAIRIHPADDVATMLADVAAGETVTLPGLELTALDAVARGHKIALRPITEGEAIRKFGAPIGHATAAIAPGQHVHSHNLHTGLTGTLDYRFEAGAPPPPEPNGQRGFLGYRRPDGRVGTRNEIWILPTVGCVARTSQRIAEKSAALAEGKVDGVHAFSHQFGCSQLGDDLAGTRHVLASLACHPNAGGVLIVGLGCEENQIDQLLADVPEWRRPFIRTVTSQFAEDETADGIAKVAELIEIAAQAKREMVGLEALVLGVKCGGSDGLSGLTANPLVGRMSDRVAEAGGSVILTEIPEIFGAEHLLMQRALGAEAFDRIGELVNRFKQGFIDIGEPVSENPSPGNVAGGITTLEEKSLGAVQKGGHATVVDVIDYGARISRHGLTLLEAPGNDAVSSTALAAAGATVILFTTGRGTPLGFPVPTVKIASNSALAARKPGWIDFDAGAVLEQGFPATEEAMLDHIRDIASGAETKAEINGEREIAIWKRGVTL
ncbi:altronate dehydratase family protein [Sphingomonas sp. BIUV-7]|uniref:Altronate dehydratase family protein n=1 Tax=Sphingomonas natans TaxID=3063330 RepID=A0ABT8Y4U3_9SPHN|nr:altronate dehydratase family protein [Sphingomonas sp. BIUV-7]MDO6413351.1 altronate dehydratase family protein [Sphingomonas sp. BIUV-7]